jgi:hypothetical protein
MAAVVRASRATGTTAGEVERCDGRGDLTSRVVLGRPPVENFLPSTSRSRTSFKDEDTCYGSRPPWLELLLFGVGGSRTGKRTAIVLARDRKSFSLRRISIQHTLTIMFFLSCFTGWVVLRWKSEAGRYRRRND